MTQNSESTELLEIKTNDLRPTNILKETKTNGEKENSYMMKYVIIYAIAKIFLLIPDASILNFTHSHERGF